MSSRAIALTDYAAGIFALVVLALLTLLGTDVVHPDLTWLVFLLLFIFTSAFAVPLGGGFMSLLPLTALSALMILGTVQAGYVVVIGELLFGFLRWRFAKQLEVAGQQSFLGALRLTSANLAIQGLSVVMAGAAYTALGGRVPLSTFTLDDFFRFVITVIVYLSMNYVLISGYMLVRGLSSLRKFLSTLRNLLLFEGIPVVFVPLMALIYSWLGLVWVTVFATNLALASLIARSQAQVSERLGRRVKELDTLQAVGQTLSSTLHLETVLKEIYRLISELMPTDVFYIALYDAPIEQITFPLVIENGKEVRWRARRTGPGLTEYVIQTRHSLLISRKVINQLNELGVALFGQVAESWLGAPMMVGDEVIGVIAVQSYVKPGVYTPALEQVLATVAAQAGMAIHNARLYARIDETLERRVRELNSILQATADGIVLFDLEQKILTANASLGSMLNVDPEELQGQILSAEIEQAGWTLLDRVGFSPQELESTLHALTTGEIDSANQLIRREDQAFRRVLTPVRDRKGAISGWLLVLNDRTEEQELERMRDDMLHMVVHDLRAPLTTLMGSLAMMKEISEKSQQSDGIVFYDLAERGGKRMLSLVNTILEISRLESGGFSAQLKPYCAAAILGEAVAQLSPAAQDAHVTLVADVPEGLPMISVDGELIGRVIYNLVDNAIKFSPDFTEVRLSARLAAEPGWLELSVTDQGKGIPEDIQVLLFNKFQRDRSMNARRGGTGLGLYFCRLAVESHGGRIWVESQLDQGSTFRMTLPVEKEDEVQG